MKVRRVQITRLLIELSFSFGFLPGLQREEPRAIPAGRDQACSPCHDCLQWLHPPGKSARLVVSCCPILLHHLPESSRLVLSARDLILDGFWSSGLQFLVLCLIHFSTVYKARGGKSLTELTCRVAVLHHQAAGSGAARQLQAHPGCVLPAILAILIATASRESGWSGTLLRAVFKSELPFTRTNWSAFLSIAIGI
jgi:hypothetical protein